jgi:hypothetical protein
MRLLRAFLGGIKALFRKGRLSSELDEELGSYLEAAAQEKMRGSLSYANAAGNRLSIPCGRTFDMVFDNSFGVPPFR